MIAAKTKVSELFMVGKSYAARLAKLEIKTVDDLLHHYPVRYDDYRLISPIAKTQPGEKVTLRGTITAFGNQYTRYGKNIQKGVVADHTGQLSIIFFNQPFLDKVLRSGIEVSLSGLVEWDGRQKVMRSPEYEIINVAKFKGLKVQENLIHTGRLVPVYPETAGVSSKWLRSRIAPLLRMPLPVSDWLPAYLRDKYRLVSLSAALRLIHFPANMEEADQARARLAFDELLLLQLQGAFRRQAWQKTAAAACLKLKPDDYRQFIRSLPFRLTDDQSRAVDHIMHDLSRPIPANRLLLGDVGAGKTVVAAFAVLAAYRNSQRAVLMAPTEILAEQHYATLQSLFRPYQLKINLLTSSRTALNPQADVFVGTHALLFRPELPSPGLVVIDEQHRFGVGQRAQLLNFDPRPHLITMTATPIPRTMALAYLGDLDQSVIREMPQGRKTVKTWVVPETKRESAYQWIKREIDTKHAQAFIVCPLIDPSEKEKMKDIRAVTAEFERLKKSIFPAYQMALLHGRLKPAEKNRIITDFERHRYPILVTTPVIEVGIDIPDASIMMIEGAERFGLAQLHQLRGRVGRRRQQAYCLLFPSQATHTEITRLKAMESHFSGFTLADIDLKLRGPGEIYGREQSGFRRLKIASLTDDRVLQQCRLEAAALVTRLAQFPLLQEKLKQLTITDIKPN